MQKHLPIFGILKQLFLHILLFLSFVAKTQDKIYLTDGTVRVAKILEISPDNITFVPLSESGSPFVDANETIYKGNVVLIEYKSGLVEIYTLPRKNDVFTREGVRKKDPKKDAQELAFNFASVNTLALCNADISGFFERLIQSKKLGFGCMAAYNFNRYAINPNAFIRILSNAKKNYDLGVFLNLYPGHFKRRTTFYFGALIKYTSFEFSNVIEERVGTSVNIKYVPAKGSQLATIVNIGTHTNLTRNFFIKTIAGIGGFRLRGDYKEEFNYLMNKDNKPTDPTLNYNVLPKIYLGLNLGFSF